MAYEPDRVVVELIAKNEGFDPKMQQSAKTNEQAMNKIIADAGKAEAAVTKSSGARSSALKRESDQISAASKQIGSSFIDLGNILSSPKSPFVAPVQAAPKVSAAMKIVQVGAIGLGGALGGVAAAAAVKLTEELYNLVTGANTTEGKIRELVDAMKDDATQTHLAREAKEIFANTLEGVEQALDNNEDALKKLNDAEKTAARRSLEAALAAKARLEGIQATTQALIDQAKAELAAANARVAGGGGKGALEAAAGEQASLVADLTALEERVKKTQGLIARADKQITDAFSRRIVELAQEQADPLEKIRQKYEGRNGLIEQARLRAIAEGKVGVELRKQVDLIVAQQRAEEEAERKRQQAANRRQTEAQQRGRQISLADAKSIVQGIGGTVTSGFRTPEHNKEVGGVPNSFHTKGQALDIAKTAGITLTKIVQAFEKAGVHLIEQLDEGDHFHIAFGKRGGSGPSAETIAKRELAAADQAERREQAFQNEKATLQAGELEARQALITSAEEIANIERASIEIARTKYNDNVDSLVTQRKLTKDEAKELKAINDERAKLRKELVERRERERKFAEQERAFQFNTEYQTEIARNQADVLQSQQAVAKTAAERRDIEKRLIDLQFQEERIRLEAIIAYNERLKLNKDALESERIEAQAAATIAQLRLDSLNQRQTNAQASSQQQNQGPLDSYFGGIQKQADDLNTAFEYIAANGLQTFEDKLTDAIVNFRSLGDVGRAVLSGLTADLVRLAIRLILNATIGKLIGTTATAATAAQAAAAATAWAPAAALASLATLGANAAPAAAAITATNALAMGTAALSGIGGAGAALAEGGKVVGPGTPTSDSVPIRASRDEFMVRASAARAVGYDVLQHINNTGRLPGFRMGGPISPRNDRAAPTLAGYGANDTMREVISEAVNAGLQAMPEISLYASLDPVDVLQRALGTRAGQKALVVALGRNATSAKAALG